MRVGGGSVKGRRLTPPVNRAARPTSSMVRSAVFNILRAEQVIEVDVVDFYAGCGSLGIEALSRGAASADFIDNSPDETEIIRRNLDHTGFIGKTRVLCASVEKAMGVLKKTYGLVLMDPPYKLPTLDPILHRIASASIVEESGVVVVGHSKRLELSKQYGNLYHLKTRQYGDSKLSFFERGTA